MSGSDCAAALRCPALTACVVFKTWTALRFARLRRGRHCLLVLDVDVTSLARLRRGRQLRSARLSRGRRCVSLLGEFDVNDGSAR